MFRLIPYNEIFNMDKKNWDKIAALYPKPLLPGNPKPWAGLSIKYQGLNSVFNICFRHF